MGTGTTGFGEDFHEYRPRDLEGHHQRQEPKAQAKDSDAKPLCKISRKLVARLVTVFALIILTVAMVAALMGRFDAVVILGWRTMQVLAIIGVIFFVIVWLISSVVNCYKYFHAKKMRNPTSR